ncbi:unnamed protein product [Rhizoctonia solani]|uniref:Uncharacterized protein n=1 Tax=Rhizoctonia solani TaxID=456999 RepID=A0A8H3HRE8_9AGAM|nr:unnamed protein product [Rhizoctonia solani]
MWKVSKAPRPDLDLFVYPYLDGVRMCGRSWTNDQVAAGETGRLGHHPTGPSSFRLYEFGKRKITDREDTFQTGRPRALFDELNTIKVRFAWGHQEAMPERAELFNDPTEAAPIHETEAKFMQGRSGYSFCDFRSEDDAKSTIFIFRYASRDWLQAQDIIERRPRVTGPSSPRIIPNLKRRRSITPEAIVTTGLETKDDDDDIVFVKHVIPAKAFPRKKKRLVNHA